MTYLMPVSKSGNKSQNLWTKLSFMEYIYRSGVPDSVLVQVQHVPPIPKLLLHIDRGYHGSYPGQQADGLEQVPLLQQS